MDDFDWQKLWEQGKIPIILGLIGLLLVSVGIFTTLFNYQQREPEIEIIAEGEEQEIIWVDLSGAVEKPGVYELPTEARMKDLLARAGGLSAEADREWVEKNINLAQKLVDGAKLYIPIKGELTIGENVAGESASLVGKININTASASELDTLWGIGEARAEAIIDNRPYSSVDELLSKKVIPTNVFEEIKDEISVY